MEWLTSIAKVSLTAAMLSATASAYAAQLSTEARAAIPHDVQQLLVIDYKAIQSSTVASSLRDRVMPPELKPFDEALRKSGLNENHDVDQLAFVLYRPNETGDQLASVGIAQGQFAAPEIVASFRKQRLKAAIVRGYKVYPLAKTGMVVCFIDSSTMVFGDPDAVHSVLDARDGMAPSLLTNEPVMDAMKSVDHETLWSVLDSKGTQTMLRQVLGSAGSVADFETVSKHLRSSWYGMDFQHGVSFDLSIDTGDSLVASTLSSLFNVAVTARKSSGTEDEKRALANTSFHADAGNLAIQFSSSDSDFISLLHSPLFQGLLS